MNQYSMEQPPTYMPPPQTYMAPSRALPDSTPPTPSLASTPDARYKGKIFKIAFYAAILFFVLSHDIAYKVMNNIYMAVSGRMYEVMSEAGCATGKGKFLHAVVFFICMLILLTR
jgi:hypothetical protein